jgi:hypothetical protein
MAGFQQTRSTAYRWSRIRRVACVPPASRRLPSSRSRARRAAQSSSTRSTARSNSTATSNPPRVPRRQRVRRSSGSSCDRSRSTTVDPRAACRSRSTARRVQWGREGLQRACRSRARTTRRPAVPQMPMTESRRRSCGERYPCRDAVRRSRGTDRNGRRRDPNPLLRPFRGVHCSRSDSATLVPRGANVASSTTAWTAIAPPTPGFDAGNTIAPFASSGTIPSCDDARRRQREHQRDRARVDHDLLRARRRGDEVQREAERGERVPASRRTGRAGPDSSARPGTWGVAVGSRRSRSWSRSPTRPWRGCPRSRAGNPRSSPCGLYRRRRMRGT